MKTRLNFHMWMTEDEKVFGRIVTHHLADMVMLILLEERAENYQSGLDHETLWDKLYGLIPPGRIIWANLSPEFLARIIETEIKYIAERWNTMKLPYQEKIATHNPLRALGSGQPWLWHYPFHGYEPRARGVFRSEFESCEKIWDKFYKGESK